MQKKDLEQYIVDLQARLAFQEDILYSLNQTVADQDKAISLLKNQLKRWELRLDEISSAMDSGEAATIEPPPPHY
jgi:SlyX protein